jgi:hypothetical protein
MPRPTKLIRKTERVTVRFTKTQMTIHKGIAAQVGISVSEYIARKVNEGELQPRLNKEEAEALPQLIGIANNLNQAVKKANAYNINSQEIQIALEEVNNLLNKLR